MRRTRRRQVRGNSAFQVRLAWCFKCERKRAATLGKEDRLWPSVRQIGLRRVVNPPGLTNDVPIDHECRLNGQMTSRFLKNDPRPLRAILVEIDFVKVEPECLPIFVK